MLWRNLSGAIGAGHDAEINGEARCTKYFLYSLHHRLRDVVIASWQASINQDVRAVVELTLLMSRSVGVRCAVRN